MDINVISETDKRMIFVVKNEDSTFFNLLKKHLYNVKGVVIASFTAQHPLVPDVKFIIDTDGKIKPRDALKKGAKAVKKQYRMFLSEFEKIKPKK